MMSEAMTTTDIGSKPARRRRSHLRQRRLGSPLPMAPEEAYGEVEETGFHNGRPRRRRRRMCDDVVVEESLGPLVIARRGAIIAAALFGVVVAQVLLWVQRPWGQHMSEGMNPALLPRRQPCFVHIAAFSPRNNHGIRYRQRGTWQQQLSAVAAAAPIIQGADVGDDNDDHDRRPHVQRVSAPRPARRLNHAFRYLYRGGLDDATATSVSDDPLSFLLSVGYTETEVVELSRKFPPLLQLSVSGQLAPKVRFLRETVQLNLRNETERQWVPPEFYGLKLEAIVAPRHAFLVHAQLPSGRRLLDASPIGGTTTTAARAVPGVPVLWSQFVKNCRQSAKHFAAFCQSLRLSSSSSSVVVYPVITGRHVEAFQTVFSRGLLAAARNDLVQPTNEVWDPLQILDPLDSSDIVSLLIAHGANATERDHRGATLLHWACGTGNLKAARILSQHVSVTAVAERDGASPLHWAAAGATPHEFGTGGHPDLCQYLMEQVQSYSSSTASSPSNESPLLQYINRPTKDGNTPLMWAAWSGTLDTVKLLVRNRADATHANRNGCTVAHWAASGGNLSVCRYLREVTHVDFAAPNHGGNTPLTHAVAFGRADVVAWLTKEVLLPTKTEESMDYLDDDIGADAPAIAVARTLAENMVRWTGGEQPDRNQVLRLFDEWAEYETGGAVQLESSGHTVDEDDMLLR